MTKLLTRLILNDGHKQNYSYVKPVYLLNDPSHLDFNINIYNLKFNL